MAWKELGNGLYRVTSKPVMVLNRQNYTWLKRVVYFRRGIGLFVKINNKQVRVSFAYNSPNAKAHTL